MVIPRALSAYGRTLLENSMMPGLPQIAATKNPLRRLLKAAVFLVCIVGFVYQTYTFMTLYWRYPTVVDLKMRNPQEVLLPAVTVCNSNRVKRTQFCEEHPKVCHLVNITEEFCNDYPRWCELNKDTDETILVPNELARKTESFWPHQLVKKFGHTADSLIKKCSFEQEDKHGVCKAETFVHGRGIDHFGRAINCYTINSHWKRPLPELPRVPLEESLRLRIHFEPEEYFHLDREVEALLSIHSPYAISNPYIDGFTVKPGLSYLIFPKQTQKNLLPSPYGTNCTDYIKAWKDRGEHGPLTREMCFDECRLNKSILICGCADETVLFPHEYRLCNESKEILCTWDISTYECSIACPLECQLDTFEVKIQQEDSPVLFADYFSETEGKGSQPAIVTLHFGRMETWVYTYKPKYETVEVFSFIGGYVGIWLGVSLFTIMDFFETVVLLLRYLCRSNSKRPNYQSKKISQGENYTNYSASEDFGKKYQNETSDYSMKEIV